MDLHFEVSGNGQPLIILHGLFGSLDNWRAITGRLAGQFKVFSLDQRNHGRSRHTFEMDYGLMAQDVRQLLQTEKLDGAYVLGHSMGGKTAMQLALRHPELVPKLIIADMAPRRYSPRHAKIISGMLSLDLNRFESRKDMEAALAPAVPDLATRQFLLKNVVRVEGTGFRWRLGLEQIRSNYSRLLEPISSEQPFDKPALFLRGATSDYLLESDFPLIQHLFPRATMETIPETGHLLHVQRPDWFIKSVQEFLVTT